MKRISPVALPVFVGFLLAFNATAQEVSPEKAGRPRTVTTLPPSSQAQVPAVVPQQSTTVAPRIAPSLPNTPTMVGTGEVFLTPGMLQSRISEAQRLLKSRPRPTANTPSIEFVTIAALDPPSGKIHLFTLSKETFLTKGTELSLPTSLGSLVTLRILRANGVNTAMTIFTADGKSLIPLTIEYPIERNGLFREMAYYTSAHPALLSNDLIKAGQTYVRTMLDLAAKRLREKGETISSNIVDIAERLCIVEHTDHDRFRQENRLALFSEIYSLYALNEIDTYRYSVSVAGAGGMVQMIPWAYNLERQRHPGVGLNPDFVVGMRNHGNALQAMLLYMQDTWNELYSSEDIRSALESKQATMSEIMAAGYNSNAAKLPGYIRRGGDGWRTLIPRETQMYLQIYKSFESLVPLKSRSALLRASGS
ncbi:MAG: hypothetical protein C5B55_13465 [Blastocatellia bacterium]|nr:MAG: hypothetical protein C5B55_13465 [Blastocatellia bacterium]